MARRNSSSSTTSCALCEGSNLASVCSACVNLRLNEYYARLVKLRSRRDSLYSRLAVKLEAKRKAEDRRNWSVSKAQNVEELKDQLDSLKKQLAQKKAQVEETKNDLKSRNSRLDEAYETLNKKKAELSSDSSPNFLYVHEVVSKRLETQVFRMRSKAIKQACQLFPVYRVNSDRVKRDDYNGSYDQICNARLPRGLDPHSVPAEELAASLGYMVQLLSIIVPILAAPALHNSGFAGSSSRIWQRESYWSARPSQSKDYPLFIPRKNFCLSNEENSMSEENPNIFDDDVGNSEKKGFLDPEKSNSFNFSSASTHSKEIHKDLQKGISLLKKSVACITSFCFNKMGLEVPSELSTFEAFGRLLAHLSTSKSPKDALSSDKKIQQVNRSIWMANSTISSNSCLLDSTQTTIMPSSLDSLLLNSAASFLYSGKAPKNEKSESLAEGWDMVERATLPPPPSKVEDVEHWTRAMFTDAKKK